MIHILLYHTFYGQHHVIVMDKSSKHYNLKIQNFSNEILREGEIAVKGLTVGLKPHNIIGDNFVL